jgi:c-di-GMP-related signal transduction protein
LSIFGSIEFTTNHFFNYTAYIGNGESNVSGKKDLNNSKGVETQEQLAIVTDLGCHYMQGYYFSAPISAGEASNLLKNKVGLNKRA